MPTLARIEVRAAKTAERTAKRSHLQAPDPVKAFDSAHYTPAPGAHHCHLHRAMPPVPEAAPAKAEANAAGCGNTRTASQCPHLSAGYFLSSKYRRFPVSGLMLSAKPQAGCEPALQAVLYHLSASLPSCSTPLPVPYASPIADMARVSPCAAAFRYHRSAFLKSIPTPFPKV